MRRDSTVLGIDAQNDFTREFCGHLLQPSGRLQRLGTNNHPLDTPRKDVCNVLFGSQAPAKLARHAARFHNGANTRTIAGSAVPGTIQIDDMEDLGPFVHPPARHGGGIRPKDGFLLIIALPQPHTLAAA